MEPRIQYAKTEDGVNIAYSVSGEGRPFVFVTALARLSPGGFMDAPHMASR